MNKLQDTKFVNIIGPQAIVDNASWTTAEIDTKGFDYAQIVLHYGTSDLAVAALAVTESDASGSGHANVTGLVVGTSTDIDGTTSVLPSATDDDGFVVFDIDLKGRKRYLDLTATAGNGTAGSYASALAILSRAKEAPNTSSERGTIHTLRV